MPTANNSGCSGHSYIHKCPTLSIFNVFWTFWPCSTLCIFEYVALVDWYFILQLQHLPHETCQNGIHHTWPTLTNECYQLSTSTTKLDLILSWPLSTQITESHRCRGKPWGVEMPYKVERMPSDIGGIFQTQIHVNHCKKRRGEYKFLVVRASQNCGR